LSAGRVLAALIFLTLGFTPALAQQRGSLHYSGSKGSGTAVYTGRTTPVYTGQSAPYTGRMTPAYTGRSTPYTGQMTPAYTGRSTPYTGRTTPVYTGRSTPYTGRTTPAYQGRQSVYTGRVPRQPIQGSPLPISNARPLNTLNIGDYISTLPVRHRAAYYPGGYYYYYNGYYFRDTQYAAVEVSSKTVYEEKKPLPALDNSRRFELVNPVEGTVIDELPVGATQVKKSVYKHRDVYYRPTYHEGEVRFIVSKP
jgi:hypothetical protein